MIPILYEGTESTFSSNGIGALVDAISCVVEEQRNGRYELVMDYPVTGQHFKEIMRSRIILALPYDGASRTQPFTIFYISKPINGRCRIKAEHVSYQLLHIPVMPFGPATTVSDALQDIKGNAAESCPYTFWTDKTSTGSFEVKQPKSVRACLGGEKGSILQSFGGGEYEWDRNTVKLYQHRGANNGVEVRYGKNLTDLTQEESIAETITGVCPFWSGTDGNNAEALVTLPEKVLHSASAASFPFQRTAVLDCSSAFSEKPTVAQLRAYATNYINDNDIGVPKINLKIKFLPLWQSEEYKNIASIERVKLCDTVTVIFEKLGVSASAKVIKTKFDVLTERYTEIELGDAKTSMVQAIKADVSQTKEYVDTSQSRLRAEMISAMEQIIHGDDGDIVFTYDETTGARTNILAMDASDPLEAKKILMINYRGIGGFTNGLNDQAGYTLAITTDGHVNAESIAAGTIFSSLMLGSSLRLGGAGDLGQGSIKIYDSGGTNDNNLIGRWDRNGLRVYKGTINGPNITVGGLNNESGFLKVNDANGDQVCLLNNEGADISGNINAKTGTIGNFTISDTAKASISSSGGHLMGKSLWYHTSDENYEYEAGMYSGGGSTAVAFYACQISKGAIWNSENRTFNFYVRNNGELVARKADITGAVKATSGTIGSATNKINIGSNATNASIYNGMESLSSPENGFYLGSDGFALGGGKFKVTKAGAMTATNATITGQIKSTDESITRNYIDFQRWVQIVPGKISIGDGNSAIGNIAFDYVMGKTTYDDLSFEQHYYNTIAISGTLSLDTVTRIIVGHGTIDDASSAAFGSPTGYEGLSTTRMIMTGSNTSKQFKFVKGILVDVS